jgi:hypothetical protein
LCKPQNIVDEPFCTLSAPHAAHGCMPVGFTHGNPPWSHAWIHL